jgi:uncharacterized protein YggE
MIDKKKEKKKPVPRSSRYGLSDPTFNDRSLKEREMTLIPLGQRQPVEGLTVVGEATRDPLPDIVELGFEIHATAYSAALAVQDVGAKVKQIRQGLARVADGQTELQSGGVAVWPILQPPSPQLMPFSTPPLLPSTFPIFGASGPPIPTVPESSQLFNYRAVSTFKVAVQDSARLGEVVDTVTAVGAIPNGKIRFLVRDEAGLRRTLLEEGSEKPAKKRMC